MTKSARTGSDRGKGSRSTRSPKRTANLPRRTGLLRERDEIIAYFESQSDESVVHAEKSASELVGSVRHDIWDVHCANSRWWVITNPTNLYTQADFKSRDVALTFHVGLTIRVHYLQERKAPAPDKATALVGSWRRWQQAFEAYDSGDEAENFQAVGVRLRECLVSFIAEMRRELSAPPAQAAPKAGDFKAWIELVANDIAQGDSVSHLRSYLKKNAVEVWDYVNWLTHAKNALRPDAGIGLRIVEHFLEMFSAARVRWTVMRSSRCGSCGSYRVVGGVCEHCDWNDPSYVAPETQEMTEAEISRRLAKPCSPTSDISTLINPHDFTGG